MKNVDTAEQANFQLAYMRQTDINQSLSSKQISDTFEQLSNWENEGGMVDHEDTGQNPKVTGSTSLISGKG